MTFRASYQNLSHVHLGQRKKQSIVTQSTKETLNDIIHAATQMKGSTSEGSLHLRQEKLKRLIASL